MSDPRQQPADLAIAAFVQDDFQFRRFPLAASDTHGSDAGHAFRQMNAAPQPVQGLDGRASLDSRQIGLVDPVSRMGQAVRQIAVVGDQDQPFAGPVQPADREQPFVRANQVDHAGPPIGIPAGRDDARRLVHGEVQPFGVGQRRSIHADQLPHRIDARAEFRDDLAIDFDATGQDQLLAFAAAADAGGS